MSKLLVRPHRYPDECIVSYLIRISEKNGFNHIGHLLQHAGLPWKNLRVPNHQIITGEYDTKPYFTNLGLNYTDPRTTGIFKLSRSADFTTKIFVKTPKICPKCLENDGYSSDLWCYIAYTACIKHKLMLVDTNPNNGKRLSWYRSSLDRFTKDETFQLEGLLVKASPDTLAFSKTMACLIEARKPPKSTPTILRELNFAESLSLIHFIAHYQYRLFHGALFSPASLDNLTASHHYTEAWRALKKWPKGFHMLLSQYIDNPMSQRGQSGINKHFRDIHEKLHRQRDNKGIARLRGAFDQFIETNWPNAIQANRLTRISLSSDERPLISQKETQSILNCREPRVHSLISQGRITPHRFKEKTYFYRDEINCIAKLYENNWSMEQAVSEIELSRYQLKQLLDAGIIKSLQKADHQNRDWLIYKQNWIKQMDTFKRLSSDHVTTGYSLSGLQKKGFQISDIFLMLKTNKLMFAFKPSTEKPLSFKQLGDYTVL